MKRFYFQIPEANVIECIWAVSFIEAKQKAAHEYMQFWNKLEWIEVPPHPVSTTLPVTIDD